MNLSVGIVGLPNVGKSTLFNALVKRQLAQTGKHPFTTIEPNKGVVSVPDDKLSELATLVGIKRQTPVALAFIDIAGLVKGASTGEGLGSQFLSHIREVSVILHVLRAFSDPTVSHIHQKIDPVHDLAIVKTELFLKDIESVEKALASPKKEPKTVVFLQKVKKQLEYENPSLEAFTDEEKEYFRDLPLLSYKPQIIILNVNEKEIAHPPEIKGLKTLPLCAKIEEELGSLSWIEKKEYLKLFDLKESALDKVIAKCFEKLTLLRFYTIAKGKEARVWAVPKGTNAQSAAGKIHTDFAKRFIKAEVISIDKLLNIGSWQKAHEMGKIAIVGRDYVMQNEDVVEFKIGT